MISPAASSSFKERLTVMGLRERTAAMAVTGKQTNRIPFSSSCPLESIASNIRQYMTFAVLPTGNPVNALGNGIHGGNGVSMVALLKGGRINNRLLCELATHKDFIKFLADIEIYVDGIATMQIQNLNALVDTVRHEIIERYRPGEDDPHLKVLQAAHISDDEYFSHMVLDDLNLIIRDIREAHKKDSESAPQTTVADELKENLEAVENFKGSRDEKLVVLYCKQLGINYKNLSDEEFRWLIRILQKSKKTGTPISQRKKR